MTIVLGVLLLGMTYGAYAASKSDLPDWQDPFVLQKNRMPMTSHFETDGLKQTLNGTWDFCWYETIDSRSMDFYRTDYDASGWDTMPDPGLWEMNGYGDPVYKNVGYAWDGHYKSNPPYPAPWHNFAGQYRRTFVLDDSWNGKDIFLHIGSATSNVRVWINGKEVDTARTASLKLGSI